LADESSGKNSLRDLHLEGITRRSEESSDEFEARMKVKMPLEECKTVEWWSKNQTKDDSTLIRAQRK
jgi:hypothetical protein